MQYHVCTSSSSDSWENLQKGFFSSMCIVGAQVETSREGLFARRNPGACADTTTDGHRM